MPEARLSAVEIAEDPELFERLRELRKRLAQRDHVFPYMVFSDKVLHSLASLRPLTLERLGEISGIGEFKKNKYGNDFLAVIRGSNAFRASKMAKCGVSEQGVLPGDWAIASRVV